MENLDDYITISLVGGLYKLLAKVLVNRLNIVMGKVISENQMLLLQGDKF